MQLRILTTALCSLILLGCQNSIEPQGEIAISDHQQKVDEAIWEVIFEDKKVFNWNEQTDHFICEGLPLAKNILVAGYEDNAKGKQSLDAYLSAHRSSISLEDRHEQLGIYFMHTQDCRHISAIRNLDGVAYVELDYFPEDVSRLEVVNPVEPEGPNLRLNENNPGLYDGTMPYRVTA